MVVASEITWKDLVDGIKDGDVTIRLALASERKRVQELADAVVTSEPRGPLRSIYAAAGSSGRLLAALSRGRMSEVASRQRTAAGMDQLIRDLSISIVAVENGKVIGVAVAGCPVRLMGQAPSQEQSALVWRFLAKLYIVSVDQAHRGRGIGGSLVDVVTQLYDGLGMTGIYGECSADLTDFYAAHGYDVSEPGVPVSIRNQVPVLEFVQGDPDECTLVRRLRDLDDEHLADSLPWMNLEGMRTVEIDYTWRFAVFPTPEGMMPTMVLTGLESMLGHLRGEPRALIARIEQDRVHLCRNDPTMSTAQSAIVTMDDIGAEHALWVAAARELGKCTLHLVRNLPDTQDEFDALAATDGLVITARVDNGWEQLGNVAELLGTRPPMHESATPTPPEPRSLFRRLFGK